MFDFEKLTVYTKAKEYNQTITTFLQNTAIDKVTHDQHRRASFSIMLNIAEDSGRFTRPDKRNFYVISRGSAFEYYDKTSVFGLRLLFLNRKKAVNNNITNPSIKK